MRVEGSDSAPGLLTGAETTAFHARVLCPGAQAPHHGKMPVFRQRGGVRARRLPDRGTRDMSGMGGFILLIQAPEALCAPVRI